MRQQNSVEEIIRHAQQIRRNTIISLHSAGSGHPGGALSMVEIIAVLYFYEMNISPDKPEEMNRDRFVCQRDTRHRLTMPHWQNGDILKRVL